MSIETLYCTLNKREHKFNQSFFFNLQLGFFIYHTLTSGQPGLAGPVPIDSMFIYRPDKRQEVWRFVFYMVLHAG